MINDGGTVADFFQQNQPAWMGDPNRNCRGENTAIFFDGTAKALGICNGCPVQEPCLRWALENNERGTWGGMSERARKRLRKQMNLRDN